ncbi:MAG: hypothetical protein QXI32_02320 [Candidatus Bathyarchaeia archaeon]
MRKSVVVPLAFSALILIIAAFYIFGQLRSKSEPYISDIFSQASAFNNTLVKLQGRLEPYPPETWSFCPPTYCLLRDKTGAIVIVFPSEPPMKYLYGKLNITGYVHYVPQAQEPCLWLYIEVSSYCSLEASLRLELRRTGGIAGLDELFVVNPDGSGWYMRGQTEHAYFNMSSEQLLQLRALIIGNDLEEVKPEVYGPRQDVADYFSYTLNVTYFSDGKEVGRKTVSWVDEWALKEKPPEKLTYIHDGLVELIKQVLTAKTPANSK